MARYLQTAQEANGLALHLFDLATGKHGIDPSSPEYADEIAEGIARLVNYGLRMSPRPVQGTVRHKAVEASVKGLPVKVSMEKRTDEKTGKSYNALITQGTSGEDRIPLINK